MNEFKRKQWTRIGLSLVAVAVAVLLPMYKRPYITFLNGANLFQHTLCPILGFATLPFMDPVEKRDAELCLELLHLHGDGGLGIAQRLRRLRKVVQFRYLDKGS